MDYKKRLLNLIYKISGSSNIIAQENNKVCFMANNDKLFLISNQKYITAQIMSQKLDTKIYIVSNKNDKFRNKMTKAYGFDSLCLSLEINPLKFLKSVLGTLTFLLKYNDKTLPSAKIGGIHAGDLIYDTIIRQSKRQYTIKSIFRKNVIKEVFLFYFTFYTFSKLIKKYNPEYFIAQDLVYRDGFMTRIINAMGAQVILLTTGRPTIVFEENTDPENLYFSTAYANEIKKVISSLGNKWDKEVDDKLNNMFAGEGDWNIKNAYKDKLTLSRQEVLNEMGINNGKKNIFIMAHCFSDSPHTSGSTVYKDYFHWLVETLKYASRNDKVNWILKPHPSRHAYGESGVVEQLFEHYKSTNLHWFPEKYSTKVIKDIADCLLTVNGSVGYEMACFGIPCINTGTPFYSYFGYTLVCKTKEEYLQILDRIQNIKKLSHEQINIARKVFFAFGKVSLNEEDLFSKECNKIHSVFLEDKDIERANIRYVDLFAKYCQNKELDNIYDIQFINRFCEENTKKVLLNKHKINNINSYLNYMEKRKNI